MTTSRIDPLLAGFLRRHARCFVLFGLVVLLAGCGRSKPIGAVGGKVQYRGDAVTEGTVTLYSPDLGFGNESIIKPDGTFLVEGLPHGSYQMAIRPSLVVDDLGGKAFPISHFKKADDIPAKYRNPSTSGFSCEVEGRRVTIDLQME